jgi:hypothetical protein
MKIVKYLSKLTGDYSHEEAIPGYLVTNAEDDYTLMPTLDDENFFFAIGPLECQVRYYELILRVRWVSDLFVLYTADDTVVDQYVNINEIGFIYHGAVVDADGDEHDTMGEEILELVKLLWQKGDQRWIYRNLETRDSLMDDQEFTLEQRYNSQHTLLLAMQARVDSI